MTHCHTGILSLSLSRSLALALSHTHTHRLSSLSVYPSFSPLFHFVMTLFRSGCHRARPSAMNVQLRAGRTTTAKGRSGAPDRSDYGTEYHRYHGDHHSRVFDYQRVPVLVSEDPSPIKRPRPSSPSSTSSSPAALRMKSSRATSRGNNTNTSSSSPTSSKTKLKMSQLLAIKRELTVIKVQIDDLLDCVDKMDKQRKDSSDSIVCNSPHQGSVSSLERESPEPGEASEDELPHYQTCYPPRIRQHRAELEDDL
ncbi:uncharacterized protein LOC143015724 [Genypterus blacodes]|uniref:uncharacterized protein LOC143015724 n=1 Tax=Genypterus blacodes TaxID=154954 RepID=UPI003F7588D9